MVTLHEVITFFVSMQISISSLQTHNVNRCGRSRHFARKLSLRRKRSSPNVFEMAATETITSIILIKLIRVSLGTVRQDRKSGSAGMPRPISYAVFCLKKKIKKIVLHREKDVSYTLQLSFTYSIFLYHAPYSPQTYTLSLHDALPILEVVILRESSVSGGSGAVQMFLRWQQRKP